MGLMNIVCGNVDLPCIYAMHHYWEEEGYNYIESHPDKGPFINSI